MAVITTVDVKSSAISAWKSSPLPVPGLLNFLLLLSQEISEGGTCISVTLFPSSLLAVLEAITLPVDLSDSDFSGVSTVFD